MFVTGRFALLIGIGAVPLVLLSAAGVPTWPVFGGWLLLCLLLLVADVAFAAGTRTLAITRRIPNRARLGEPVLTSVAVTNIGRRALRGLVRDAWQPTAVDRATAHCRSAR